MEDFEEQVTCTLNDAIAFFRGYLAGNVQPDKTWDATHIYKEMAENVWRIKDVLRRCAQDTSLEESKIKELIMEDLALEFPCLSEAFINPNHCNDCKTRFECHSNNGFNTDSLQQKRDWMESVVDAGVKMTEKEYFTF